MKYETDPSYNSSKRKGPVYKCHFCKDKFCPSRNGLYSHYSFIHYKAEILKFAGAGDKCPYCGIKFGSINAISHIGLVHDVVEKFLPEHLHIKSRKSSKPKPSLSRKSPPWVLRCPVLQDGEDGRQVETVQSVSTEGGNEGIIAAEEDKEEEEAKSEALVSSAASGDGGKEEEEKDQIQLSTLSNNNLRSIFDDLDSDSDF